MDDCCCDGACDGACVGGCCEVAFGGVCISFSVVGLGCVQNFLAFVSPLSLILLRFMGVSISLDCSRSEFFFFAFFQCFLQGDQAG